MASGGLRASFLSTVENADAGYKALITYFPRHLLYCVLCIGEKSLVKVHLHPSGVGLARPLPSDRQPSHGLAWFLITENVAQKLQTNSTFLS